MPRQLITFPDVQFADPSLNRLMQHIRAVTQELQRMQSMLDDGETGQVLIKRTNGDYDASWGDSASGGSGLTGADNVGSGIELSSVTDDQLLQIKTLLAGTGISITETASTVRISLSGSSSSSGSTASDDLAPLIHAGVS